MKETVGVGVRMIPKFVLKRGGISYLSETIIFSIRILFQGLVCP
jgi:hypothetical protein